MRQAHLADFDEGGPQVRQDAAQALCLVRRQGLGGGCALYLAAQEPAPEGEAHLQRALDDQHWPPAPVITVGDVIVLQNTIGIVLQISASCTQCTIDSSLLCDSVTAASHTFV